MILVDTGFSDGKSMTGRRFECFESADAVLGKIGLQVGDVDTVVLTHLHFDHAGNFDAFPNARIVVQRREFDCWKEAVAELPNRSAGKDCWALSSMDVSLLERIARAVRGGSVELIEGDAEVAPGVYCRLAADTHTFGSQWVEVETTDGPYVVAGDCVYWYRNIESMWPPSYIQGNTWNLMRTLKLLRSTVGPDRIDRIVPGHDIEVFKRHKSWTVGGNPVAEIRVAAGERSRAPSRGA